MHNTSVDLGEPDKGLHDAMIGQGELYVVGRPLMLIYLNS